jgi:hypothetical protein
MMQPPGGSPEPSPVPKFEARHLVVPTEPQRFTEADAPDWLTSARTVPGSTMDERWFWRDHVLTLPIGGHVETDFHRITRVA